MEVLRRCTRVECLRVIDNRTRLPRTEGSAGLCLRSVGGFCRKNRGQSQGLRRRNCHRLCRRTGTNSVRRTYQQCGCRSGFAPQPRITSISCDDSISKRNIASRPSIMRVQLWASRHLVSMGPHGQASSASAGTARVCLSEIEPHRKALRSTHKQAAQPNSHAKRGT